MRKQFRAISLFSGAGGMDVGFEKAGVKVVLANELMQYAAETYKMNHPDSIILNNDINKVLYDLYNMKNIDIVFGGPPCQGFSVAGKMNPDDERSRLIFTFLDVVKHLKPKAFVMENVKALAKLDRWKDVRSRYLNNALEAGYTCVPFVLNAADYGVSQKRERVFFIGIKNTLFFENELWELIYQKKEKPQTVKELLRVLGRAGSVEHPATCTAKITFATNPIMRKSPYAGMYFNGQGRPINLDGCANTLPASMGGNKTPFLDEDYLYDVSEEDWVVGYHKALMNNSVVPKFKEAPRRLRRITLKEAAKIQSFPDEYIFCGNKASIYTQIGNAVPCKFAYVVANALVQYLDKHEV